MSGPSNLSITMLIGLGAALAILRILLWRRNGPADQTGLSWRLPTLIGLNLMAAALLYLTLDPPDVGVGSSRLVVRTGGATTRVDRRAGDVVVALPEASPDVGERVPDLATALRRHPEVRSLVVLGAGLTARDRSTVDRPVTFDPSDRPLGLTRLVMPDPVSPGGAFIISGSVGGLQAGSVELADPSGAVVDRVAIHSGAEFVVTGAARTAGLALFDLQLKDAQGRLVERVDVPLEIRAERPPRVVVLAGAPGPEPRFLRRWADQAGIDISLQLGLGAGVELTARPAPLTAAALAETDLLIIDERRWENLGSGERAEIRAGVAGGMGLLLRPTGPLSESTRRDWAALGAPLTGGETLRALTLEQQHGSDGEQTTENEPLESAPDLTLRDFVPVGSGAAVMLSDADRNPLATWRPYGDGRVGVWVVADSYALVLTGQPDRYGALWSRMFSVLARPDGGASPALEGIARAGQRASLCAASEGQTVIGPDGTRARLVLDPRSGSIACAAFWPRLTGWYAVSDAEGERGIVYVHPADATPSVVSSELRQATLDLARSALPHRAGVVGNRTGGSPWPWFLAFVAIATVLWWLERRRPKVLS
ncbi:hypothetical protein [Brevundimonas bacteroides]|uniref:hypothetical protein n=1 Tax=Brevundimonas bacteroides TaxID=74311 RepID=UPI000496C57D|nr:hypothetical protein [Brevundimonas bacteroides]